MCAVGHRHWTDSLGRIEPQQGLLRLNRLSLFATSSATFRQLSGDRMTVAMFVGAIRRVGSQGESGLFRPHTDMQTETQVEDLAITTGSLEGLVVHAGDRPSPDVMDLLEETKVFGSIRFARFEGPGTPLVDASNFDLVVADLGSPAAEIAFAARSSAHLAPFLFVTRSSAYDRALLLRSGACDIVSPATHPIELIYRIRSHVARHRRESHWARRSRQLDRESRTDELTGLPNRRLLDEVLHREFERARRHGMPMTAVMADLDGFKTINDSLGHSTGDTVLRELASALTETLRATDIAGRYGGDEFLAILSNTHREGAAVFADRWRRTVGELDVSVDEDRSLQLSMSVGVAEVDHSMVTPEALVKAADVELYRAKGSPLSLP